MHLALGIPRSSINGCPLLWVCVHGVCVFTAVCVHFGWVICRARIPSMGHPNWPYVTSLQNSEVHLSQSDSELAPDITCAQHGNPGLKMHLGCRVQWETPEDHAFLRWTCLRSVQVSQSSRKVRYVYLPADWQVLYADVSTLCRAVEQQVWLGTVIYRLVGHGVTPWLHTRTPWG